MATVGSSKPGVSPVLLPEHHGHRDCEQSHDRKKRPTRAERIRRGRHRDKLRVQTLRDQLAAACSSSSDSSASEDQPQPGVKEMQQQLAAAISRISDLEKQNQCLRRLVEELTHSLVLPTGPASPELFDVYDIAEETANVATQTEISVNFQSPDIFVRVQDLPVCAAECHVPPQCAAGSHLQPLATAHADAAAGFDAAHATHNRLRNFTSISQARLAVKDDPCTALVGPSAEGGQAGNLPQRRQRTQCGPLPLDFNSQDLASTSGHLEVVTLSSEHCTTHAVDEPQHTQCGPLPQMAKDFNSQDLACLSGPLDVVTFRSVSHDRASPEQSTAPVFGSFSSQDLANPHEPLEEHVQTQCGHMPHQSTRQALDDTNSKHRVARPISLPPSFPRNHTDVKSRCRKEPHKCQISVPQGATQMSNLGAANSQWACFKDFNSQDLALSAGPFAFEQCTTHVCSSNISQDLANTSEFLADFGQTQCGHLPQSTRQALEDTNTRHRVASSKDFNSQDLALSALPFAFEATEQCTTHVCKSNISQDLANTSEPLADYGQTQCGHLPQSTRQALEDTNSKHRVARSEDFNSQDLALPAGPCASEHKEQCTTQMFGSTNFQDLATTHEPLEHLVQTQCGHLPQRASRAHDTCAREHSTRQAIDNHHSKHRVACSKDFVPRTRQALDDTHSKHRVAGSIDFNSQDLAPSAGPVAFEANEQCTTQVLIYNSQDLATTSEPLADFGQAQCGHLPQVQDTRQALDDPNTKHRGTCSKDFISQDLAPSAGPFAIESNKQCTTQVFGSANSQNLAATHEHFGNSIPTQCGHLPQLASIVHDASTPDHGTRQALEDPHSKHRVACSKDFNSLDLAHSSEPFALGHTEQSTTHMCGGHNSQDLATIHEPLGEFVQAQCGHLPRSRDFNSQDLAVSSRPSRDLAPTSEQVQDFERTLLDIIDIFNKRRKVSNDLIRRTARAIQTAATIRGVDISQYRAFIHSRSLRLSVSIF